MEEKDEIGKVDPKRGVVSDWEKAEIVLGSSGIPEEVWSQMDDKEKDKALELTINAYAGMTDDLFRILIEFETKMNKKYGEVGSI
jgi:hypothetical protein